MIHRFNHTRKLLSGTLFLTNRKAELQPFRLCRTFSAKIELSKILKEELKAEKEQRNADVDPEYVELKKNFFKTFQVTDRDGLGVVTMVAKHQDETVTIRFDCQDEEEVEPDYDEEDEQEDEQEPEEPETALNFDVEIKKPSGELIVVSCSASSDLKIGNVRYVPAGMEKNDNQLYSGPEFNSLDDRVTVAFRDYLKEYSVDEDLAYFISSFGREKEQKEYLNWLHKLEKFTA